MPLLTSKLLMLSVQSSNNAGQDVGLRREMSAQGVSGLLKLQMLYPPVLLLFWSSLLMRISRSKSAER